MLVTLVPSGTVMVGLLLSLIVIAVVAELKLASVRVSIPSPPSIILIPVPAVMVSSPAPPLIVSLPSPA